MRLNPLPLPLLKFRKTRSSWDRECTTASVDNRQYSAVPVRIIALQIVATMLDALPIAVGILAIIITKVSIENKKVFRGVLIILWILVGVMALAGWVSDVKHAKR